MVSGRHHCRQGAVTPQGSAGPRPWRPYLARLPSWAMLVAPVDSALQVGGSRQPLVCSAAAMAHRDMPSVTVAPVASTPIQVMRKVGCRQSRPSVSTATHRPLVAPKVWACLSSGLGSVPSAYCQCMVISESGRTGASSLRVNRLVTRSQSTAPN